MFQLSGFYHNIGDLNDVFLKFQGVSQCKSFL